MLGLIPHVEGTPPVYYCLAWVWARVFGFGEAGIRSLSAVAGVLLIPVAYAIGARLISRRAGLVAAWLVACNPFLIWYSQEARAYSLLALVVALALLAFAHLVSPRPRGRWIIAWTVFAGLALATHYYAAVALVPAGAFLLWTHRRDPRVWYAMLLVAVVAAALAPTALHQSSNTAWIAKEALGPRVGQVPAQFVRGTGAPGEVGLQLAGWAVVALAGALLARRLDTAEGRGAILLTGLALAGFLLSLVLAVAGADYVIARNLIPLLVLLILGVAGGLTPPTRRAGLMGAAGAAVLCAIGVIATIEVATDWAWQRPGWSNLARTADLAQGRGYGQLVIQENGDSLEPLGLYVPRLRGLPPSGASVRTITLIAVVRGSYSPLCWWGAACHLTHQPLDTRFHIEGFRPAGSIRRTGQFDVLRFTAPMPVHLSRGRVVTALQSASLPSYGLFVTRPG